MTTSADFNWTSVASGQRSIIFDAFSKGNITLCAGVLGDSTLIFIANNRQRFMERGLYETALLNAYTMCRINWSSVGHNTLVALFGVADRGKLQALGAPLPAGETIEIFRGVSGNGRARRVKGLSWTLNLDVACWFAMRLGYADPAVFKTTICPKNAFCYCADRGEDEIIALPERTRRLPLSRSEMEAGNARFAQQMRTRVA